MDLPDIIPEIKEFLGKLLGPSAEEFGLWGGQKIRFLRFKSSVKTFNRANELLKEAGFSEPKPVDLKTLLPLMEFCSLENEDSDLIEKWAGLLATASSLGLKNYAYPHILNQLSPIEVKIIDMLHENYIDPSIAEYDEWFDRKEICNKLNISKDDSIIYFDNLFRLGVAMSSFATTVDQVDKVFHKNCLLTPLGYDFTKACKGPVNK
jgi:hypothetical protein